MGTLYIVATPIGNLEDISIRALKVLSTVDYIACEDTRRAGILLQELEKRYHAYFSSLQKPVFIPYYDQTELTKTPEVIDFLNRGKNVALISDAGTPLLNDPGYILVMEARKRAIPVISIPGASALLTALTSSGLPLNTFTYLGYPPEKNGQRLTMLRNVIASNKILPGTYVFYCAPHKVRSVLEDMKSSFGDIDIVVSRELTKVHEEYWKGRISDATTRFSDPKGEFVLLFNLSGNYK